MLKNCDHIQITLYRPPEIILVSKTNCREIEFNKPDEINLVCSSSVKRGISEAQLNEFISNPDDISDFTAALDIGLNQHA